MPLSGEKPERGERSRSRQIHLSPPQSQSAPFSDTDSRGSERELDLVSAAHNAKARPGWNPRERAGRLAQLYSALRHWQSPPFLLLASREVNFYFYSFYLETLNQILCKIPLQSSGQDLVLSSPQTMLDSWPGKCFSLWHSELQYVYVRVLSHSGESNSLDLINCNPPGSSVHGIFQAKILQWVAISFPRGCPKWGY